MVEIGRTIISRDIFEQHFLCDLLKCKGACCVEGDSGAPLVKEEAEIIEREFPNFQEYLPGKHKHEIEKQGYSVIDKDGDLVTPLINDRQCVYSFTDERGILKCAIEKAFFDGKNYFSQTCFLSSVPHQNYGIQTLRCCKLPGTGHLYSGQRMWKIGKIAIIQISERTAHSQIWRRMVQRS
jgi:hypothetical protein